MSEAVTVPCLMEVARRRMASQCVRMCRTFSVPPSRGCKVSYAGEPGGTYSFVSLRSRMRGAKR